MAGRPRLKLNLALLYGAEMASKVLGIVVFGYLAVALKDPTQVLSEQSARYGDLEFAIGLFFLMQLVLESGLAPYGARESSKNPGITNRLAGQIIMIRLVIVGGTIALLTALAFLFARDPVARQLIMLYGLVLMPAALLLNWAFQARNEMWVIATGSVIRQCVLASGVFLLVQSPDDVIWVPVSDAAGLFSVMLFQQVLFRVRQGRLDFKSSMAEARRVFLEALPIAGSAIVWACRTFFPLFALYVFTGPSETGIFGAGHRLVVALHTFVWLYFFNLLPTLSRFATMEDRAPYRAFISASLALVAWVVFMGGSIGTALAPFLVELIYHGALPDAAGPFSIMVWMLATAFLSGHHRFSLIAFNHQGPEFRAALIGASVSILLCLSLYQHLTPTLAAAIFLAAEVATLIAAHLTCSAKIESLPLLKRAAVPFLVALGAVGLQRWLELPPLAEAGITAGVFLVAMVPFLPRIKEAVQSIKLEAGPS